jgi:hypothetical protein
MKQVVRYEAVDGRDFFTREECLYHELNVSIQSLINITPTKAEAIVNNFGKLLALYEDYKEQLDITPNHIAIANYTDASNTQMPLLRE